MGPVVDRPIREAADVDRLQPFDPRESLAHTMDAIRLLVARLDIPVLGFVAREIVGDERALQGNLDPACLLAGEDFAMARGEVLDQQPDGGGHIFNVGHGVLPETDPTVVGAVVDFVHERSSR